MVETSMAIVNTSTFWTTPIWTVRGQVQVDRNKKTGI